MLIKRFNIPAATLERLVGLTGNPTTGTDKADQPGHVGNPRTLLPDQPKKKGRSVRGADKKQVQPSAGKQEQKETSSRTFINSKLKKGLPQHLRELNL